MTAYLYRMPAGRPGHVSRRASSTLEPGIVGAFFIPYGAPVKVVGGKFLPLASGDDAAVIYGFMSISYPTTTYQVEGVYGAAPGSQQSVLRRGYMTVALKAGASSKPASVYVRLQADNGKKVGDIEASPGNGLAVVPATFMGEADADGNVEIAYNI